MGLMIYDNQDGPFELRLASVRAYLAEAPFRLTQYRWKNRVLVVSAPTEDDKNLQEQLGIRPGSFALRLTGKDGSVKLSSETATLMTEIYALIDTMPMRQREKPDR